MVASTASFSAILKKSFNVFKQHGVRLCIAITIFSLVQIGIGFLLKSLGTDFSIRMISAVRLLSSYVLSVVALWYYIMLLRAVRNQDGYTVPIKYLAVQGFKLGIASSLFSWGVSFGTLLLVFPGIYIATRACLYPFYLADGYSLFSSFDQGMEETESYTWYLLPVGLAFVVPGLINMLKDPAVLGKLHYRIITFVNNVGAYFSSDYKFLGLIWIVGFLGSVYAAVIYQEIRNNTSRSE